MLKAAIIYIPGTGGSFLRRALSLGQNLIVETAYEVVDVDTKFALFNNWNFANWKSAEKLHRPAYRYNKQEFYHFEQSKLWLIDAWHPTEFLQHDIQGSCWISGYWDNLIFINVNDSIREFIECNQQTKAYQVDWQKETSNLAVLRNQYKNKIVDIDFDDLCNQQEFLLQIDKINSELELELDMNLVAQLWKSWHTASDKIWQK
jgi:hypothetical protein